MSKRVLVTGHTGFKGGWLSLWLESLGAHVIGIALQPNTTPSFFDVTGLGSRMESHISDIRNFDETLKIVKASKADIIFHLAAQPLVRASYVDPIETYSSNVMGTVHVLEAARALPSLSAIVCITTDKVYANDESNVLFEENDRLGGHDPYSTSKAACELAIESYRRCFFNQKTGLASARAGNVIGGGDWSKDRLIPDLLRALDESRVIEIRHPHAIRPWQHVIEPLAGYLRLAQLLSEQHPEAPSAFNFGPQREDCLSVSEVIHIIQNARGGYPEVEFGTSPVHEAGMLRLDNSKAKTVLKWQPRWRVQRALMETLNWHECLKRGQDVVKFSLGQINDWEHS